MKKKLLITLSVVACALLLVVGSIAGTIAYLTSTAKVTNTFTVGNVSITLDEGRVGEDGKFIDENQDGVADTRVSGDTAENPANKYHLLPGHEYDKDPTIHVGESSENCWLFVEITDEISAIQDTATIKEQLATYGWVAVAGETNVYAYNQVATAGKDYVVFKTVKVKGTVTNEALAAYANKTVSVIAYAVQQDGFATAQLAWEASGFGN